MEVSMIDIAVQDLNKYYGSNHVIKGISFEIFKGEKVGLLGKNGSGKTTLFKILSGTEEYEGGKVAKATGKKIEVLEQIPFYRDEYTVEDVLYTAFDEISSIFEQMRQLEVLIKSNNTDDKLLNRYGKLQTEYEALGGYNIDSKIDRICSGMKIINEMRSKLFSNLSGGEKTRVNLARILLTSSDILLLDEPTNHLDMESIKWIEEFIRSFTGTVVAISHDRCFLDNIVNRILEIEDGKLNFYEGNYSFYVEEKQKRFCIQSENYEQQQRKIVQLEVAAKRMHEWARNADNPAMHKRAFSIEKRIERIERIDRPIVVKKITAEFKESNFSSNDIVTFKDISKAYGEKQLFDMVNLKIQRNDRIAIVGDNGCGKSTLIKLLSGDEIPAKGEIITANSIKMAYLPQIIEFKNIEATVLDTIRYELESNEEKARSILAAFHFKGQDVLKKTGMLSGGEKSRLQMCILMQSESNFLVLDEPTNHLDIASREWIEEAVSQFSGTIMFTSHDRYFINKFATRIWEIKEGAINDFYGTFTEYCQWKQEFLHGKINSTKGIALKTKTNNFNRGQVKEDTKVMKNADIESQIIEAENRLKSIYIEMDMTASDFSKLNLLYEEKVSTEKEIDLLYSKWSETK